ncbi:hypothetical protein PC129_g10450 [Phytophthora cactorum]|uniref:ZSWIM1/3 RNaseH-like domain-containing protein n=1 Tax=Phytophthora cactorum TaxID=29920 RepID=A0A8T1I1I1_9STRA|nr:hypothetical protein PC129_g10450 [Phytophthora cactorum]
MVMQTAGGGRRSSDAGEAKGGEPTDETAALRVGIGDGANARKEDMVKLAGSKKVAGKIYNPICEHCVERGGGTELAYYFREYSRGWSTASLLADAKASTKDIGVFLSRQLGRKFTPQQTKNLLKRIGNNKLSQDRLKMFLYALAQVEGNEVMLMQDQFDVTCGIVIQTPAQNLCFEHWGQTLAMDWTHSTNNLGFHLGSLVATGSSGCGIPVFDFMAVNEKAKTLKVIFE